VKEQNLGSLFLNYHAATSRRPGISFEFFFTFPGRPGLPASGRKSEKLRRWLRVFGCGSAIACNTDQSDLQARARMFQHEVFGKSQSIRPGSARPGSRRFDPAGPGSICLARRPERILILFPASRDTSPDVALIDKAHRGSSLSLASGDNARQERSIEGSRRAEPIPTALT